jgi:hypothetical protein
MPPWGQEILDLIIGPVGGIIVLSLSNYFTWKLFREEQVENRENFKTVGILAQTIEDQTSEMKIWREAGHVNTRQST